MATQNNQINIKVQFLGATETITSIEELTNKLNIYKEVLESYKAEAAAGNKEAVKDFQDLSAEISNAEGKLELLQQQQVEGQRKAQTAVENTIGSYIRLGGALTTGFAAAKSAIALFGAEGEELQEAATKAQVLLTLGLAASTIAQEAATLAKIKDTAVTIANTVAQQGLIAALRLLWATMLANPLTAILAALGAVVSLLIIFADTSKEAAEETKTLVEFQQEAAESAVVETQKLKILNGIVRDGTKSLDARNGAYNELKKILPELEGLTLDQAIAQGSLNKAYEREIQLIKLRAQAKGLEDFIAQQKKEEVAALVAAEAQEKLAEQIQQTFELQQDFRRAQSGGFAGTIEEYEQLQQSYRNVGRALADGTEVVEERSVVEQQLYDITAKISELEQQRQNEIDDMKDSQDKAKKSQEQLNKERQAYIKLLLEEIKLQQQLLIYTQDLEDFDNKLIDSTQKKIDKLEGYKNTLQKLETFQELYTKALEDFIVESDIAGPAFLKLKDAGETFIDGIDAGVDGLESFNKQVKALKEGLDPEQALLLEDFAQNYRNIFAAFNQEGFDPKKSLKVEEFQKVVTDLNLALGKITIDPYTARTENQLIEDKKTARERYELYRIAFENEYTLYYETLLRKKGLTEKEIQEQRETTREIAAEAFKSLTGIGDELLDFEQGVKKTTLKVGELGEELKKLSPDALRGFLVENAEQIAAEYAGVLTGISKTEEQLSELREKLRRKDYSEEQKYNQALISLQQSLSAKGIDISTLTYAQKLVLLEAFLDEEVKITTEAEEKKQKKIKETQDSILENIQLLSGALQSVSQTLSDFYSAQLDNLDRQNEYVNSKIVGDSEEANQKRLEQEQYYQNKRKELEKKANLTALRFSQIQAIANIAEAITKVTAQTGIGAIIAGSIVAAAGAVQVGIIQSQINSLNSFQRGGLIKGQGGLLVGPSHEFGGIRYGARGLELEGGEAVINRQSRVKYQDLLNQINISGGGRPLVQNNFDDSRIVEAIAKQRQEPIRAYIVESDITNKQAISKRLERLSQF